MTLGLQKILPLFFSGTEKYLIIKTATFMTESVLVSIGSKTVGRRTRFNLKYMS